MTEKRTFHATPEGGVESRAEGAAGPESPSKNAARGSELMTFSTHILSLNAAGLMHLGLIADPDGGDHRDLEAARHVVDTLAVLREKTRGNLTPEEQSLLDTVLHELRIRFVQAR